MPGANSGLESRHYRGGKALHLSEYAFERFMLELGCAVESVQDNVLDSGFAIFGDLIDDFLGAAEEGPAFGIRLGAVQEFQRETRSYHQRVRLPSLFGADLPQVGESRFDVLDQRARRMPAVANGRGASYGLPAIAADPQGNVGFLDGLWLEIDIAELYVPAEELGALLCP